ncbi:uncharacterized protein LOC111044619 [Nilaparvata lugens]|uniref:uncharacterized protein LOC111044619 n=1 Tax=Nilaparvata lugens TaxID=108931 RepID=UPI00193D0738|nr:uncharacterized protein LOC111044619 [Nilaparvata lugens]
MNRFHFMIIITVSCSWTTGMSKQVRDDHETAADSLPVAHAQLDENRGAILTSLLLGALAAANPALTNTLLITNPYLAAYFVPPLAGAPPPVRAPYAAPPIYGYTAINPFQDSSAFGSSYKRELKQK